MTGRPATSPGGALATAAVRLLLSVMRALPERGRRALGAAAAWLVWTLRIRRSVALENLRAAFPEWTPAEVRSIGRRCYRHLASVAIDAVSTEVRTPQQLESAVVVDGWGELGRAIERGGVLVASAHLGNWELLAEVMALRLGKLSAVVRPLRGAFNAQVIEARQKAGVELILQRGALKGMIRALRQGRVVTQLIDQALPSRSAVQVPFFGRPASTTPAISVAALRTGAPVFVAVAAREHGALRFFFEGPVPVPHSGDRQADIRAHTATLTAIIEGYVRRFPDQWLWLHRRWK